MPPSRPCSVVRVGNYKLHEYFEDGGLELYDLSRDVRERNNLAASMPEKLNEMRRVLRTWQRAVGAPIPSTPNPEFDPAAEAAAIRRIKKGNGPES
ncbi:MAG: hypothetical protein JW888_01550 [Pirellulales bacterium]|nr:hypothetical protein [Pirellulales bacterium]